MTVRQMIVVLSQYDGDLQVGFEWDEGFSSPRIPPYQIEYGLIFDVSQYMSMEDEREQKEEQK